MYLAVNYQGFEKLWSGKNYLSSSYTGSSEFILWLYTHKNSESAGITGVKLI